jgi:hypothetical protein
MTDPWTTLFRVGLNDGRKYEANAKIAAALELDASFFEVKWGEFGAPALALKTILPLSLGINPTHLCGSVEWAETYAKYATGAVAEKFAEMLNRYKTLVENLEINGGDVPIAVKGNTDLEHRIKVAVFVAFADAKGWDLPVQLATGSAASRAETPEIGKPTPRKDCRDTGKRESQIQAIENAARDIGYLNPLEIPTGGRAAIKAHCIAWKVFGKSESGFRAAWREANRQDRIRLAEKEKYMSK